MSFVVAAYAAIWIFFITYFSVIMRKTSAARKALAAVSPGAVPMGQGAKPSGLTGSSDQG
ncbi:MAG: hypothetical protein OEZ32_07700 [Nitrospinota bacterium]|nr:hypothetical protein [Nitrospinota bacterium]